MGLIGKILAKDYSLADFDRDIRMWIGGLPTNTGITVNELTALRHITVYSCVRVRSETIACLPLSIYKRRPNRKGQDEAWDHSLYDLLRATPNNDMTSMTWRETMNGHLDLSGNGYSIITTNKRGQAIDIYPWDWRMITPGRNEETGKIEYHLNDRGKIEILPAERVFHVPGWGFDGIQGFSIIRLAREAVALGIAITEFSARFFGQGMNIGSVLQTDQPFNVKNQDAMDSLKQQFEERYSGLANAHRPIVLTNGFKFTRIPMPLTDAQFVENSRLNQEQICGLYRVPPHLVANLGHATFSNIEQQSLEFMIYSMLPVITRYEQTMNWKLLTPAERAQGYFCSFNMNVFLRGDSAARAAYLNTMRQNGAINADEWREQDGMNPIDGDAGEAYLVNGNMISTETAAKQQPKRTGGGEEQNPPQNPPPPGPVRPQPGPTRNGGE